MSQISRVDRAIGALVVILLVVLAALGVKSRYNQALSAAPHPSLVTVTTDPSAAAAAPSAAPASLPTSALPALPALPAPATTTTLAPSVMPEAGPVSAVGDSIMLDIRSYLQVAIPGVRVDGQVSRQFQAGIQVVEGEKATGTLGTVLVVELGTNGPVASSDFDALMRAASGVKRVVFVDIDVPRPWAAPDNAVLAAGVARYPGVAVLADWYALSSAHPEWFTPDQVHLEPAGAQALADLVARYA